MSEMSFSYSNALITAGRYIVRMLSKFPTGVGGRSRNLFHVCSIHLQQLSLLSIFFWLDLLYPSLYYFTRHDVLLTKIKQQRQKSDDTMSADITDFLPTASCTTKNPRFFFFNGNEAESCKHAMREHWRKRKERKMAAREHDKPFRSLRFVPKKDHMVCRMEAQSHSDDPILSQDHPYIREAHRPLPMGIRQTCSPIHRKTR